MKPFSLVVLFAPLALSLADVVDSAPATGAGVARDISAHKRAIGDVPSSPWHRRHSDNARRQTPPGAVDPASGSTDPLAPANVPIEGPPDPASTPATTSTNSAPSDPQGPPETIVVSTPTTTEASTTESSSESSSSSSETSSSSSSTETSSSSSSTPSPTPEPTTTPTTTDAGSSTNTVDNTPPASPTETGTTTSSTDTPIIVLPTISLPTISLPTISLPTLTDPTPEPTPTETSSSSGNNEPGTSSGTDVPPTETPTTSGPSEPPTTSGPSEPPSSTPPTSTSGSTSSSSTPPTLNPTNVFPTDSSTDITPTVTITETSSTRTPITIDSQFQFLTASSFITDSSFSTSTSVTLTNPDEALTTPTLSAGSATTLIIPPIPSTLPLFITPPPSADPLASGLNLPGFTEISILFQLTVRWTFVLNSSETAAQIIAYMPQIIKYALDSGSDSVRTIGLSAYQTTSYRGPDDLMTLWSGYLKTELVQELAAMVKVTDSTFYNVDDPVAKAIAKSVVGSYDIASVNGVSNTNGSSNPSNMTAQVDNSRRNAIIGVCVTFGLIALIVIGWWIMRMHKARKDAAHKRLSYEGQTNYGAAGHGAAAAGGYSAARMRPDSPPNLNNPFMTELEREEEARGVRRNSFYAIGPDDASLEEDTFDYMSQRSSGLHRAHSGGNSAWANSNTLTVPGANSGSRRPVVGQPISQPILRESSMGNW